MPDWFEITLPLTDEITDPITNFLFEIGCTGCEQIEMSLHAYFPATVDKSDLHKKIQHYLSSLRKLGYAVPGKPVWRQLSDRDWNAEWKKHFKPVEIGERFVIKPTWEPYRAASDKLVIEIDPGQAFGTGTHATTRLMLMLLEKQAIARARVLDIGTGTGVLAIAAAKLQAGKIVALDVDPVAVSAASKNIRDNVKQSHIELFCGELGTLSPTQRFELVLANIDRKTITEFLRAMLHFLAPAGRLLLSGILIEDADNIIKTVLNFADIALIEERVDEEWVGLVFQKAG